MKRYAAIFLILLILSVLLSSCEKKEVLSCSQLLRAMTDAEIDLPAGKYYSLSAAEGDDEYLSRSLLTALYGNGALPRVTEAWSDCALYLPFSDHPCEFAVIYCRDLDSAEDTARLMSARLAVLKNAKSSHEYSEMLEKARVVIVGNYTLLVISSDSESAIKIFKKALQDG